MNGVTTWYVRDASGNVMSVYVTGDTHLNDGDLTQHEVHLYGSSRLGLWQPDRNVQHIVAPPTTVMPLGGWGITTIFIRSYKFFELSNHLGNVMKVVSDRKRLVAVNGQPDHYEPVVTDHRDYYAFGMPLNGLTSGSGSGSAPISADLVVSSRSDNTPSEYWASRSISFITGFESGSGDALETFITAAGGEEGINAVIHEGYRYGFGGQERTPEVGGDGYTAEFWQYDSRLGRRWNLDPITKPWESPYAAFGNNPIWNIDPDGADTVKAISNAQLVDAIKIASSEVKNVIKNKEKYFSDAVNSRLLDAATNYWEQHQKEMNFAGFVEFKESVDQYYNGLATVAWWSGTSSFEKLDRAVINNKGINNYMTAHITAGYIQETNANMWGIMGQAVNTAMFVASAGVGTTVGTGPKGAFKSNTQQQIVISGKLTKLENKGLNEFFANNTTKIKVRIDKQLYVTTQKNAEFINPPSYLTREALLKYRNIAEKAINGVKGDGVGAQKVRIELIDQALKNMK